MNFLKNLKLAFSATARNELVNEAIRQDQRLDRVQQERERIIVSKQYAPVEVGHKPTILKGNFYSQDISDLVSDYSKSAICSLGSWAALAKGFNEFTKNTKVDTRCVAYIDEFHMWNAMNPKPMDDEAIITTIAKLSTVQPAKANDQTDAIIARVRKTTIDAIRTERLAKAEKQTKAREDAIESFAYLVEVNRFGSDLPVFMPAHKVEAKLVDTLMWVAGWDSSNPSAQAAELMLIESDIKLLRDVMKQDRGNNEDFVDGMMTTDYPMRSNGQ